MSTSRIDYLAAKYLTKDESSGKKKKKKKKDKSTTTAPTGGIVDEDADFERRRDDSDDDDDGPVIAGIQTAEFRKTKKSNWKKLSSTTVEEDAAADAIVASAAKEIADKAAIPDDERPVVVNEDGSAMMMESGAFAGLQTAEQVTAAMKRKRDKEMADFMAENAEAAGKNQETIYRDASGRIINVAMQRAEARKKAEEEEARKLAERENLKGVTQVAQAEARRKELEDAKYMKLGRGIDDVELNEEQKAQGRWNDPAAEFLTKSRKGFSKSGFPLYTGHAPPNRYGILPGHKWDGVDRSNGTEKMFFQKANERKNRQAMEYAWEMDV